MMHSKLWTDMFQLGLPVAEKILRPVIVYLFLIAGLRLAGKRELAQLNTFDLVVLLTLSNTVQNAIIGDDNTVIGGLIGATTLLAVNFFVVRFLVRHPTLDRLAEGQATTLIHEGKLRAQSPFGGDHLRIGTSRCRPAPGLRAFERDRGGRARTGRNHHICWKEAGT